MSYAKTLPLLLVLLTYACSPSARKQTKPATLRDHIVSYWDDINLDTASADVREQRLVDYLYIIGHADSTTRRDGWQRLNTTLHNRLDKTVSDYLGDPESPLYSLSMLDEYLTTLIATLPSDDANHVRAAFLLENTRKNRPGHTISNLPLVSNVTNAPTTLHTILRSAAGSDQTLVLFYDPDCDNCDELISQLSQSPDAPTIVAVSTTARSKSLPSGWHSLRAADPDALDSLFYLPSLPAIYVVNPSTLRVINRS